MCFRSCCHMCSELLVLRFYSHFWVSKRERALVRNCCPTLPWDWHRLFSARRWECLWVSSSSTLSALSWRLSVDLSVDGIFIIFPIITLWKVKLPRNLRRIIISAFSGSALTLITGIVFCILGYNTELNLGSVTQTIVRLASHLEVCLFLFCSRRTYILISNFFLKKRQLFLWRSPISWL